MKKDLKVHRQITYDEITRQPHLYDEYTDEEGRWHREDGPAVLCTEIDCEAWWVHGKMHRTDGPAIIDPSGYKAWWEDGKQIRVEFANGVVYVS
jgi:hypothetical protein